MAYVRENINGFTPQDLMKLNDTLMGLFDKVHGDINFSDTDSATQTRILTQWVPVQGDGNMDKDTPYTLRFYIPPNVSRLRSSDFNFILENYRMDSSVTSSDGYNQSVINTVTGSSPSKVQATNTKAQDTQSTSQAPMARQTSSASAGGASSSSGGGTSISGGGATSGSAGAVTAYVDAWGTTVGTNIPAPTAYLSGVVTFGAGGFFSTANGGRGAQVTTHGISGASGTVMLADLRMMQHRHDIGSHQHWVGAHSHTIQPHSHSITMNAHQHNFEIPAHNHTVTIPSHSHTVDIPTHTHAVTGNVEIKSHTHTLNEGIKVSTTNPMGVKVTVNSDVVTYMDATNRVRNNIEIVPALKIGEWNTIKIETVNLGRIVVYGVIEMLIK